MTRRATIELIQMAEDGVITWEMIARAALSYMSESDVEDMAHYNNLIEDEDDEEDEG